MAHIILKDPAEKLFSLAEEKKCPGLAGTVFRKIIAWPMRTFGQKSIAIVLKCGLFLIYECQLSSSVWFHEADAFRCHWGRLPKVHGLALLTTDSLRGHLQPTDNQLKSVWA